MMFNNMLEYFKKIAYEEYELTLWFQDKEEINDRRKTHTKSKKVKKIDNYFVSSDDEKILNTAFSYGFQKIKRPKHLSKANSKH